MTANIVFENATLIDGTGSEPISDSALVVEDGRIEDVGTSEEVTTPDDAQIIDLGGRTILPGLIDAHLHLTLPETQPFYTEWASTSPNELVLRGADAARRNLEAGFTTVRDTGACNYIDVALRDGIERGDIPGPRILASGPGICQSGGHGTYEPPWLEIPTGSISKPANGEVDVRKAVRDRLEYHVDGVKTFVTGGASDATDELASAEFTKTEVEAIYDEAHRAGKPVATHCMTPDAGHRSLDVGMDGKYGDTIEHGIFFHEDESIFTRLADADVPLIPTLTVYDRMAGGAEHGLPPSSVENAATTREDHLQSVRLAHEQGVDIVCGTDCGGPLAYHGDNAAELVALVDAGLTEREAIEAATGSAAAALGIDENVGTLTTGKAADLLVIDGDPTTDISVLTDERAIDLVCKDGEEAAGSLLTKEVS